MLYNVKKLNFLSIFHGARAMFCSQFMTFWWYQHSIYKPESQKSHTVFQVPYQEFKAIFQTK